MAKFDGGIENAIKELEKANLFSEKTQEEMLDAGTQIIKDMIQREMKASRYDIKKYTGKISVTKKVKKDKNGDPYKSVTISGKSKTGRKLSEVLFVLNYGRREKFGRIEGSYFWTNGTKKAEKAVEQKLEEIANKKLNGGT